MRKTQHIFDIIAIVNRRNRLSTCRPEVREGWNSLLEQLLHDSDVYDGYRYLEDSEVPGGESPGIWRVDPASPDDPIPATFPDETRRSYSIHRRLRQGPPSPGARASFRRASA